MSFCYQSLGHGRTATEWCHRSLRGLRSEKPSSGLGNFGAEAFAANDDISIEATNTAALKIVSGGSLDLTGDDSAI